MRICFLGTRNVDPERRESLGIVMETNSGTFLIDAGPYVVQGLQEVDLSPDDLAAIFISHDHADHSGGVPALLMTWLLGSVAQPEELLWGVPHRKLAMLDYARATYPFFFGDSAPRRISVVTEPLHVGGTTIQWFPLDHTVENWGVIVDDGLSKFAYVPDSSPGGISQNSEELMNVENIAMSVWGTDAHAELAERFKFPTASEAGKLASTFGAARLFLQHLANPNEEKGVIAEIGRHFTGSAVLPRAGEWIDLG